MGLFDKFKSRKKEKLPLVARVDLARIHKERVENNEPGERSILARKNYTKRLQDKIRLCYVSVDLINMPGFDNPLLDINYAATCVYKLPLGMSMEEAHQVVSYATKLNNSKYFIEPSTESSIQVVGAKLQDFGFKKVSDNEAHFAQAHVFQEYDVNSPEYSIKTDVVKTDVSGVTDLMTVGGNQFLFMDSDLEPKAYPWFRMNCKFKDIKQIYDRIGILIDENGVVKSQEKEQQ